MTRFSMGRLRRAVALTALVSLTSAGVARADSHTQVNLNPFTRKVRVADAALVTEPISGTVFAKFVVTLTGLSLQSGQEVKVSFATQDGTAVAGDYTPTAGSFSFVSGGSASKAVLVPVIGDGVLDGAAQETFTLHLRRVIGAEVTDGIAVGSINDLQAEPVPGPNPGPGDPCIIDASAQGPVVECTPGPIVE
jgi:Calx-beta domain